MDENKEHRRLMKLRSLIANNSSHREQVETDENGRTIFHDAAISHQLERIPRAYLTAQNILTKDIYGMTVGHLAAESESFFSIPPRLIWACLQEADISGNTPLHKITRSDWEKLPQNIVSRLSNEDLLQPNGRGITPIHNAAKSGFLNIIPQRLLTKRGMATAAINGETPMHLAMSMGNFSQIPNWAITYKLLNTKDREGYTPMHYLARYKEISEIPKELLTIESLTVGTLTGRQPMHIAAQYGTLRQLPEKVFTTKILLAQDSRGWTPLHAAAYHGNIYQIPKGIITEKELLTASYSKPGSLEQDIFDLEILQSSPLVVLTEQNHLDQILGIELSEASSSIVGAAWFTKNKELLQKRVALTTSVPNETDLDMF